MNRPLWRLALVYAGGLLVADRLGAAAGFWLVTSLMLAGLLALSSHWRIPLLVTAVFSIAGLNLASRTQADSPLQLVALTGEQPQIVTLHGTLAGAPSERIVETDAEERRRTLATLRVTALERDGSQRPARGLVAATMPGTLGPEFFAGQTVAVTGVLRAPRPPMAPGLFDYRAHLARREIHHTIETLDTSDWLAPDTGRRPPLADRFNRWAREAMRLGLADEDAALRLNWGMAMGWRTALTDEVSEPFLRTGTMHIFAISGLHIAFIAALLLALMQFLRLPRAWAAALTIPLVWFYTIATGLQPSAVRASVMMSVLLLGTLLRRPADGLNSLGAAALIVLGFDPLQLFQASFQLSFCVVLGILLLLPVIEAKLQQLLAPDPLLPPELRPAWQRRLDAPLRWLALTVATSLAAWLASLPLGAHYFHYFTPVSLPANVVVVPLASLALASNLAAVLTAGWLPFAAEIFNHGSWLLMLWMTRACGFFAALPGAWWHVRAPALWEFALYYAVLFGVFSGALVRERRWRWTLPLALALWASGLALTNSATRHDTTLTVLPLNGGEAVWVDAPGRNNDLLVDVGNTNSHRALLEPFLRAQGINSIPTLALTHGDLANVGAFDRLRENFRVTRIVTSGANFRSARYREIIAALATDEAASPRHSKVFNGDEVAGWTVLHPADEDRFTRADDAALVLRCEFSGVRVLLLSDLGRDGAVKLIERHPQLTADIVVAGLPASGEALSQALLDALQPGVIIVTDSFSPATARAPKVLRQRLEARDSTVLFTSDHGALTLRFNPRGANASWRIENSTGATLASDGGGDFEP